MSAVVEAAACAAASPPTPPSMTTTIASTAFAHDVLTGLEQAPKRVPGRWLHDRRGRELFGRIEQLDSYYPARSEAALLRYAATQIAQACGRGVLVIELGSGAGPSSMLLPEAIGAAAHVAIDPQRTDITQVQVLRTAATAAICPGTSSSGQHLVFFPGAAIDHYPPQGAVALLDHIGRAFGRGTLLAMTADATQDEARLLGAYNDGEGLFAAFNKNLLVRIRRELDGDFDVDAFDHETRWLAQQRRIELHLVARAAQRMQIRGQHIDLAGGESIRTRVCNKLPLLMFRALARHAGWAQRELWIDANSGFTLHLLEYLG